MNVSMQTKIGLWGKDLVYDPQPRKANGEYESIGARGVLEDTCRAIVNAIGGATILGPSAGVRWRGQANIAWRLESGSARAGLEGARLIKHETEMIAAARRIGMDGAQHLGDWEILARLRHSGATTRLIDITTDPFVALFMLCDKVEQASEEHNDGILLAISQVDLVTIDKPWLPGAYEQMTERQPAALVYETPPIDPRIAAQRGQFALASHPRTRTQSPETELFDIVRPSGWGADHLDKILGKVGRTGKRGTPRKLFPQLIGIRIPAPAKPRLREMLATHFGYTREKIYPDWAGLGKMNNLLNKP